MPVIPPDNPVIDICVPFTSLDKNGASISTLALLFIVILLGEEIKVSPVFIACVQPPSMTVFTPPFISLC